MSGSARATRRGRLLLVEDDAALSRALGRLLACNTDVVSVAKGTSALGCCADLHFDVVIADYHLPDMSGVDVLRSVRSINSASRRVLMSGAFVPDLGHFLRSGLVQDFLVKPVPFEAFLQLLDRAAPS